MAGVLTEESTVVCGHAAPGLPGEVATAGEARLRVNGHPVLTKEGVVGKDVKDCGTTPVTNPTSVKCLQVTTVSGTEATRLRVGGAAVLVDPLSGATNGTVSNVTPQTALGVTVVQTRLTVE